MRDPSSIIYYDVCSIYDACVAGPLGFACMGKIAPRGGRAVQKAALELRARQALWVKYA